MPSAPDEKAYVFQVLDLMEDQRHVWIGDFEGVPMLKSGLVKIHWEVGLVNAGDTNTQFTSRIRYPAYPTAKDIDDFLEVNKSSVTKNGIKVELQQIVNCIGKSMETGHTVSEIRYVLIRLGCQDNKTAFFHWIGTIFDQHGLWRILCENDDFIVPFLMSSFLITSSMS